MPGAKMRRKSNTRRLNPLPQQPSMASSSSSRFLLHHRKISALVFFILVVCLIVVCLIVVCLIVVLNTSLRKEGVSRSDVPSMQLYTVEVVNEFPHDPDAFTQGLLYAENDILFESTGLNGASSVRRVTLQTGKVQAIQRMPYSDFGEGLTLLGDRLIQVTWRQSTGYVYDRHNLSKFEKFQHGMPDGWGLATDGKVLYGSDGSSTLYQIDPQTMKVVKKQIVNYQGDEVHRLNELEYVYDEVWANVWMTDCIARISHTDGSVLGWILLHNLREGLLHNLKKQIDVLNGIAWDRDGDRLFEIEAATQNFADENVVACGDYAIVYNGIMFGNTRVAIKRLLISRAKAKEFTREVEVLLGLRHKNLVKLIGYCFEGYYRITVEEYVNNGHLGQWLHDCISEVSPLTWNIRMNIVLGIAKGLAYLHEDTEPAAIIHQHLKSSCILLDKQWNPKISDFGITNLLGSDESSNYPITPPIGMSGYLAPEYLSTGILDEKSDVYSFGILIMEIVSGKPPIEYTLTEIEEQLIDWMKSMVASQQYDQIVDPKLPEMPSMKELKIVLLIALRCVDPDANNRPKMGQVIHMLQPRDLLLNDVNVTLLHHNFKSINRKECV